jgi:acylphosphatase
MPKTVSIIVSGKVQGVFFRQSTKELATALDLKGQVKNLSDGSVEIIAVGEAEQIDRLVRWCWSGPPRAKVEQVAIKDLPSRSFDKFSIDR